MAAFYLAREGYRPIVLERGQDVDTVQRMWKHFGKRDPLNRNQMFNPVKVGAGTFF